MKKMMNKLNNDKAKKMHEMNKMGIKDECEYAYLGPAKVVLVKCDEGSIRALCLSCWVYLCHVLIGLTVFMCLKPALTKAFKDYKLVTIMDLHIILCTVGYQLLAAEGILCLNFYNGFSPPLRPSHKKRYHWMLLLSGSVIAIIGVLLLVGTKREFEFGINMFNIASEHTLIGWIAVGFTLLSLLNGICALYACKIGCIVGLWKVCHSFIGMVAFVLATVSFSYGILHTPATFAYSLGNVTVPARLRTILVIPMIDITTPTINNTTINSTDQSESTTEFSTESESSSKETTELTTIVSNFALRDQNNNSSITNTTGTDSANTTNTKTTGTDLANTTNTKATEGSHAIPIVLVVFCSVYTLGIIGIPFARIFNFWSKNVMY